MALEFEWDLRKAHRNLKEHGVSFDEAATVFRDRLSITIAVQITPIPKAVLSISACLIAGNCSCTRSVRIEFES